MYDSASRQLVVKREVVRGVYEAPVPATDFNVVVEELSDLAIDAGHTGGVDEASGRFGKSKSRSGKKQTPIEFYTQMKWSGDIAVAPKWWIFLEACGFRIDTTGANALAIWDGRPNCTTLSGNMFLWECGINPDGIADVLAGMAGSVELMADSVGGEIRAKFSMTAKSGGQTTVTGFTDPSGVDTTDGQNHLGVSVTKGATVYKAWSWNVAQNADVQAVDNPADETNGVKTGIDYFKVGNSAPLASATVTKVGTQDVTDTFDNTEYASVVIAMDHFEITLTGTVQNIEAKASNSNETATEDLSIKYNYIEIKQV